MAKANVAATIGWNCRTYYEASTEKYPGNSSEKYKKPPPHPVVNSAAEQGIQNMLAVEYYNPAHQREMKGHRSYLPPQGVQNWTGMPYILLFCEISGPKRNQDFALFMKNIHKKMAIITRA